MLNKKINILTLVLSEKIFLNEKTPHSHPLQVKWSVSNQIQIDELHAEDIFMIILLSAWMKLICFAVGSFTENV